MPAQREGGGGTEDPLMVQWGANLSVLAGHRAAPGALEAIVALGDRLRLEEDRVRGGRRGRKRAYF